jgi:hypothetical protein
VEAVPTAGQSHEVEWKLAGGGGWLRVLAMDDAPAGGIVCMCNGSFLTPTEFVKHAGGGKVVRAS